MKKLSIITLAVSIVAVFNTTNPFVRPTVLLAQALNKAYQTTETTTNDETGISNTTITPRPVIDYTCNYSKDLNLSGDMTAEILVSARPISLSDISPTNFNESQLALSTATTGSVYACGKGLAQLIKLPKTSIGKSVRKNGCCILSLILMEKYQKISEQLNWETRYNTGREKIEDFINQQYKKPEDPTDNSPEK